MSSAVDETLPGEPLGRKRFETARARAALRGIALHAIEDDHGSPLYVASIHALTRQFGDLGEVEAWLPDSPVGLPSWLAGAGPSRNAMRRRSVPHDQRCPASYMARWLVHYAGEGRQLHSVIRVQSVDPRGGRLKVWSELHEELQTLRWSGLRRAEDADRGRPIDLGAWWSKFRSKQSAPKFHVVAGSGVNAGRTIDVPR